MPGGNFVKCELCALDWLQDEYAKFGAPNTNVCVLGTAGASSNLFDRANLYYEQKLAHRFTGEAMPLQRTVMVMLRTQKYRLGFQWAASRLGLGMDRTRAALLWKSRTDLPSFTASDLDNLIFADEGVQRPRYFHEDAGDAQLEEQAIRAAAGDLPDDAQARQAILRGLGVAETAEETARRVTGPGGVIADPLAEALQPPLPPFRIPPLAAADAQPAGAARGPCKNPLFEHLANWRRVKEGRAEWDSTMAGQQPEQVEGPSSPRSFLTVGGSDEGSASPAPSSEQRVHPGEGHEAC